MTTRGRAGRTITAVLAILTVCLLGASAASAQGRPDNLGDDFWLGFPTNLIQQDITLFIAGPTATSGTVSIPGLAFSTAFTVTPGSVTTVALPPNTQMSGGSTTEEKGVHVTAEDEVAVYGLNRAQFTTDAYLGLPVDVLGTEYTIQAWGNGGSSSEFSVVAAQDGTVVTITPTVDGGGHSAGVPFNVPLDQGEEYQLQAGGDLSGTQLTANHPVSVFAGNLCANIPSDAHFACDHVVEQVTPDATWGRSFLTVPLATRLNGDTFRFLATEDDTVVQVNGATVATLDAGQQHQQIVEGNARIVADKPIFVTQFSNGSTTTASPPTRS